MVKPAITADLGAEARSEVIYLIKRLFGDKRPPFRSFI